jgi:RNA polymerase sigma factor (sigma-70 family)
MAAKTATPPARPSSPKPSRQVRPSDAGRATGQPRNSPTIRGAAPTPMSAIPGGDDLPVADLVARAKDGDQHAWDTLVERYAPLVWSICRRYRLSRADADDVGQDVWLRLVAHLDTIRDPAALPGWLATTTARQSAKAARAARRHRAPGPVPEPGNIPDTQAVTAEQELLQAERHAALRQALAQLPPPCQRLLALLLEDPPLSYATISARLGIPAGSIGPSRARCLHKLRRHPAIAALIDAESQSTANEERTPPSLFPLQPCPPAPADVAVKEILNRLGQIRPYGEGNARVARKELPPRSAPPRSRGFA